MSNNDSYTSDLNQLDQNDFTLGNKAFNLKRLIQFNFTVPEGFVLKPIAYTHFLELNNLDEIIEDALTKIEFSDFETIEKCSRTIGNAILNGEFPSKVVAEFKLKYENYSSYNLVVRSSATAEDLPKASFAGQYNTYLNLRNVSEILENIKKCYASLWTERAIKYRHENQIPHQKVQIAIIIQKMISVKSAGVLFTQNPINFKKDEILIESNFGLGESIVTGRVNPDQFFIQKVKKGSLKILNKRIGKKEIVSIPKQKGREAGIEYVELNEDLTQEPSLSDDNVLKLARLGLQIERKFNRIPQDIEWALDKDNQINILQTRPITTIKQQSETSEILWTRGYSDDYWNDNVTPLYFELLGDQLTKVVNMELNSIMGYKQIDRQLLKLYNAHVYFNLKVLKKKVVNEIPKFLRNDDVLNYFPEGSGPFGKNTIKELPFHQIRRIIAELRIGIYDPNGGISKTSGAYERWTQKIFDPFCSEFDERLERLIGTKDLLNLFNLAEDLDKVMINHFRLVRYGIPVHNIGMNLLTQYLLRRFLSKEDCLRFYPILVSGLKHKLTETNNQINHLASIIYNTPELKSIIINEKSEALYNSLLNKNDNSVRNFISEFEKFLNEHGDRGFTREPYYPRWKESPMTNVFDILKSLVIDGVRDGDTINKKGVEKRELIKKIVETKIRTQRFGLLKWKIFTKILKNSKKYIAFRENQRFNLDKWITRNREVFLEIGRILKEKGILADENKIFFLWKKEIKNLIMKKLDDQEIQQIAFKVSKRFEHFKKHENKLPPKFLFGSREFDDELKYDRNSTIFKGTPASHGNITAPIRVLHDINLISAVKGREILVVPQTDPGWTPVFSIIGGLITETGGILSHGAVVSREYGIPAVTNISNACQIFQTGQIVSINGDNGTVIIKK